MELSKIQKQVVEAKERFVLVNSCAGSGKTRTLTERVKHLLKEGVPAEKIVVITFTNAAAEVMMERIGSVPNLICSTVHSYANRLLRLAGIETEKFLNDENFDELFALVKKNPECIQEVEHLLLDEGQDSTKEQFDFMLKRVRPKNWTVFSDHRQSIYGFAGAYPDYIIQLMDDPTVTVYNLNENYRNSKNILDNAKSIIKTLGIDYEDHSRSMVGGDGGRVCNAEYSPNGICSTIARYVSEGRSDYRDWFILTRTNRELEEIYNYLVAQKIPCDTFKKANLDSKGLMDKMQENTVKVLTIHTAKGLEADNVVVIGARFRSVEEKCVSYVAATRAKKLLVWSNKRARAKPTATYWGG